MMKSIAIITLICLLASCKSTEGDINYGLSHYKMGLFNHALPSLLKATPELEKKDPTDPRVTRGYLALANMAQSDKLLDVSEKYYLKALATAEVVNTNKKLHVRNAKNELGNFYISQKKFETALPLLKDAVRLSQDMETDNILKAIDIDNLALVYAELGQPQKSTELSGQALGLIEKSLHHNLYHRTKGIILYNRGKNQEKNKLFQMAINSYDESIKSLKTHAENKLYENWRVELVEKAKSELLSKINE